MPIWKFREFVSQAGTNDIGSWYEALPVKGKARLDSILEHLQNSTSWQKPEFKSLKGKKYQGLGEIRFKTGGVQQRIFGMHGLDHGEYTFLIACTEKGGKYAPPNALDTAVERRKLLQCGKATTDEH